MTYIGAERRKQFCEMVLDVLSTTAIHPSIPPSLSPALTDLIWVGGVGAAVTGVSHSISVPVHLVSVLDKLAIV